MKRKPALTRPEAPKFAVCHKGTISVAHGAQIVTKMCVLCGGRGC